MITGRIPVTNDAWTEVGEGSTTIRISSVGSDGFYLRFSEASDTPLVTALGHYFPSWKQEFGAEFSGLPNGQLTWVKSKAEADTVIVSRDIGFWFNFIPQGSDGMLDSNGLTFRVKDNG